MDPTNLRDIVRLAMAGSVPPSNYTMDCFITSEVGHNDVITRCTPATGQATTGAYVGVGPCQNLTYIGALRPRLAIICDSRLDNVLEHLMFKLLIERAEDPLDYLLLLFARDSGGRANSIRTPEDLLGAFDRATVSTAKRTDISGWLRTEVGRRWGLDAERLDRLGHLYGEFVDRQLRIAAVNEECAIALESPTLRDVILARTAHGRNFHFLTDADRFGYVKRLHLADRIIPVLGNLGSASSVDLINEILYGFGETADTIYLSNVEDHVLGRYVFGPTGVVSEPNPNGLLVDDYGKNYASLVACLERIHSTVNAMLIRFFYPADRWGRSVGMPQDLEPSISRLRTFLDGYHTRRPESLLDTYL